MEIFKKHKRKWIGFAIALCVVLAAAAGLIVAVRGKKKYAVRTEPNTSYDGTVTQEDPEEIWKNLHLAMISPQTYAGASSLQLEAGSTIALIGKEEGTDFWDAALTGAEAAVSDLNTALGYTESEELIQLAFSAPSNGEDAEEQINILDESLSENPGAICIAMIDEKACEVQFDQAEENGIPVVALDSGKEDDTLLSTCATNNEEAAARLAESICAAIGEEGTVAVLMHDDTSEAAKDRLNGITKEIAENHPKVSLGKTTYLTDTDETKAAEAALGALQDTLTTPDAVIATNEQALHALEEAYDMLEEDKAKTVKIGGFDGGRKEIKRLEEGTLSAFILQNPYGMGYAAVMAAARGMAGEPNESFVSTGYELVTADNCTSERVDALLYD